MDIKGKIKEILLKHKIIYYYRKSSDIEIRDVIDFLMHNRLDYYNYEWFKPESITVKIEYDNNRPYVIYNEHPVYFPLSWQKERIVEYWTFLMCEQDEHSPHRYGNISDKEKIGTIIDAGGAEGFFTLSLIDRIEKSYIIECDEEWVEALKKTFAKNKDKVVIVPNYLSDSCQGLNITIDELLHGECVDLIKMDIEGFELKALQGGENTINKYMPMMLICVYHYQEEEQEIRDFLRRFENQFYISVRPGYIVFKHDSNIKRPYLRRGLLIADNKKINNSIWHSRMSHSIGDE